MGSTDHLANSVAKLLKVARMNADEVNAGLAAIRVSRGSTETALAQLDHAILQERRRIEKEQGDASALDPAFIDSMMAAYMERIRHKRDNMMTTLGQLADREDRLQDDLQGAYSEIKKLEHLIALTERKAAHGKKRKQDADRDADVAMRYSQSR